MRLYEIGPDDPDRDLARRFGSVLNVPVGFDEPDLTWSGKHRWEVQGLRKWVLPSAVCPACGATTGIQCPYPHIDVSTVPGVGKWSRAAPLPLARIRELQALIAPLLPQGEVPRPGTGFGPLVGRVVGNIGDFGWLGYWAVVTPRRVFEALSTAGVTGLLAAPTELKYRDELVELYAPLRVALARRALGIPEGPACETCGRLGITRPSPLIIDPSSVREGEDLMRGVELSNTLFASERFVRAACALKLRNIRFHEEAIEGQPPPATGNGESFSP